MQARPFRRGDLRLQHLEAYRVGREQVAPRGLFVIALLFQLQTHLVISHEALRTVVELAAGQKACLAQVLMRTMGLWRRKIGHTVHRG